MKSDPHAAATAPQEASEPALRLDKIDRFYMTGAGPLHILTGADLTVQPGEIVALVAPSGAGKSTLLHLAGLLERPDGGEVYICGTPTAHLDDSGRTAMRANISVHEPKQRQDEDSALAFTMEGLNRAQPGALLPWVWSPGWNSNQSVHKFQTHTGGPLKGGTAGVRLLQPGQAGRATSSRDTASSVFMPDTGEAQEGHWLLVPRQRIFGSDELSALSPGLAELVEAAFVELNPTDAASLGVTDGDGVDVGENLATLEVRINDSMASGCAGYSTGLDGTADLVPLTHVSLRQAASWRRRPQVISSDRSTGMGDSHV